MFLLLNLKKTFSTLFFSALMFCVFFSAYAATSADYLKRVKEAQNLLYVLYAPADEESLSRAERKLDKTRMLAQIRELVPKTEKIETLETDNSWLHAALDDYSRIVSGESLSDDDFRRSKEVLLKCAERLGAIEDRLREVETAKKAESLSKNQTKEKLDEIMKRPEFLPPEKNESFLQRWWREFWEWFNKPGERKPLEIEPTIEKPANTSPTFLLDLLRILVIGIAVLVVGYAVWRFIPYLQNRKKKTIKKEKVRVVLGETLTADQSATDILSEAEKLAQQGDLRLAIRKGYIALLCELSDRKMLGLARHKTNRDYLRDVRKNQKVYEPMRDLTGNFEKTWYGLEKANEEDWQEFRAKYQETLKG